MMTRKDYVSTADILKGYALDLGQGAYIDLVNDFADMFSADNPNFKHETFEKACGI